MKIGIIGVGHLGSAILQGLITSQYVNAQDILVSGGKSGRAKQIAAQFDCHFCINNRELV